MELETDIEWGYVLGITHFLHSQTKQNGRVVILDIQGVGSLSHFYHFNNLIPIFSFLDELFERDCYQWNFVHKWLQEFNIFKTPISSSMAQKMHFQRAQNYKIG
jgi:hypothetical protein